MGYLIKKMGLSLTQNQSPLAIAQGSFPDDPVFG